MSQLNRSSMGQKLRAVVYIYCSHPSFCVTCICHEKRVKIKITLVTVVASIYSVHSAHQCVLGAAEAEHVVQLSSLHYGAV